jgi:hypothetical protein
VGEQQAIVVLGETLNSLSDIATRYDVLNVLQQELEMSEETGHLLDWLHDAWETLDLLVARFGKASAHKILEAPASHLPEGCTDAR